MKWLITGGCGFIGSSLAKKIFALDEDIIIVDDLSVGSLSYLEPLPYEVCEINELEKSNSKIKVIVADVCDIESAITISKDCNVIVHLAANTGVLPSIKEPLKDCNINVFGTLNYLEASRQNNVGKFIFASSGAPLGMQEPPLHEEKVPHPLSPYGASKLSGEGYCSAYHGSYGVDTVALRFGNVYGPGSVHKQSVVAKFIKHALVHEPLEIYGDGNQTRDFIFINDLLEAIYLAAVKEGIGGEVFQIASAKERTVNEVAEYIAKLVGKKKDHNVEIKYSDFRTGEVIRNYSDTSKAKDILGFEVKTSIEDGLNETIDYMITTSEVA